MSEVNITLESLTEKNIPVLASVGLGPQVLEVIDAEITALQAKRALVTGAGVKKTRVASEDGLSHGEAIVTALETFGKTGATSKEIREQLAAVNHAMEPPMFHSTMSPLLKEGIVLKKGEKGSSVYRLKANGRKLLAERSARRGRKAAEE